MHIFLFLFIFMYIYKLLQLCQNISIHGQKYPLYAGIVWIIQFPHTEGIYPTRIYLRFSVILACAIYYAGSDRETLPLNDRRRSDARSCKHGGRPTGVWRKKNCLGRICF